MFVTLISAVLDMLVIYNMSLFVVETAVGKIYRPVGIKIPAVLVVILVRQVQADALFCSEFAIFVWGHVRYMCYFVEPFVSHGNCIILQQSELLLHTCL
jgi:hypothetical protein